MSMMSVENHCVFCGEAIGEGPAVVMIFSELSNRRPPPSKCCQLLPKGHLRVEFNRGRKMACHELCFLMASHCYERCAKD